MVVTKAKVKKPENKLEAVMNDFELFAKNFIEIQDNEGNRIKFNLNEAQQDIEKMLQNNKFLLIPKSRQAGCTTYFLARFLHMACTVPNQNILIVSYLGTSAKSLFDKLKNMNQSLPRDKYPNAFPIVKRENRNELFFSNGSMITSTVAGNKDLGRSTTVDACLLSELSFYSDIDRQLLSVIQSLAKGSHSRLVIESTANGMNSFYKLSLNADKGMSRFKMYFIPFYHKLYLKQFKSEMDEAEAWFKSTNSGNRMSPKDFEEDEKILYEKGCAIKSLMWRRFKLLDMELEEFHQEFPSTLLESFVNSSGNSLFKQSKILERMEHIIPPLTREDLENEIPQNLYRFIGRGLEIYYLPKRGKRYFSGVDVASGTGGNSDDSTLSMIDDEGQEVLSFYSNKVSPHEFAEIINEIGKWFSYSFICVERNSFGSVVLQQLREVHEYMNLYKMKTFDERGKKKLKLGFLTTETSKKIAISSFRQNFETGMININCKTLLEQMSIYVLRDGKMGNKRGDNNHDDLVISMTLANVALTTGKWYV